jgi:hypothetical protein
MRILSIEEASRLYKTPDLATFFGDVDWRYPDPVPSYFLPKDSGAKLALARTVARTFLERGTSILWITDTKVWTSSGHMDLFGRYRQSYGEMRSVVEAPLHSFTKDDLDAFISILCLGLFFVWDIEIISQDRSIAVTISHDEWLKYRFERGHENIVSTFEKRLSWLVETKAQT